MIQLKNSITSKFIIIWSLLIILLPIVKFWFIRTGYQFFNPVEVFQEMVSDFISILFPALVVSVFLPQFLQERKNGFITYARIRCSLGKYLISKAIVNAVLTGLVFFAVIIWSFIFAVYVIPNLHLIHFTNLSGNAHIVKTTFSQLLRYGTFTYGLVYSLWVSVNAIIYATLGFEFLLFTINPYVALSIPFLLYQLSNYLAGIFGFPEFSLLEVVFPFNIRMFPIWTALIPVALLLGLVIGIAIYHCRNLEKLEF